MRSSPAPGGIRPGIVAFASAPEPEMNAIATDVGEPAAAFLTFDRKLARRAGAAGFGPPVELLA